MIRRPPRSTLFPTRRSSDLAVASRQPLRIAREGIQRIGVEHQRHACTLDDRLHERRSEEHTSELQSQSNLVCRLLLEKKKKLDYKINLQHTSTTRTSPGDTS